MALKDHKAELRAASVIAGMIKLQSQRKVKASLNVGLAFRAVVAQKKFQEEQAEVEKTGNYSWGSW